MDKYELEREWNSLIDHLADLTHTAPAVRRTPVLTVIGLLLVCGAGIWFPAALLLWALLP